jgi:hypothetical protein
VLKTGATLVRQWRGHTHTVLVREDGFEYDGQRYRSLTVIAERITGAHWSGPRFFGLTRLSQLDPDLGNFADGLNGNWLIGLVRSRKNSGKAAAVPTK